MKNKTLATLILLLMQCLYHPICAAVRFVATQKVEGRNGVGLLLRSGNQNVSLKYNNATPIVNFRLNNVRELLRQGGGNSIKIDVFRIPLSSGDNEFVGSFNYRIKSRKKNSLPIKITLPKIENQSQGFEFVVYDTAGTARAKYRQDFAVMELVTPKVSPDEIDSNRNTSLVSEEMLEEIMRSINVEAVNTAKLAGIERVGTRSYSIKVPASSGTATKATNANVSSLRINATGTLAERAAYDNAAVGFVFFDRDNVKAYVKGRGTAVWSEPIPLNGEVKLDQISNGNISLDKLVSGSILQQIVNNPVFAADLNPINQSIVSLRNEKLDVNLSNLPENVLDGGKIKDSSITADDIAPGAVSFTGDRYITLLPGDNDMYYDNQYFSGRGCGMINTSSLFKFITKRISFAYCLPTYSLWTFQVPTDWELGTDMAVELEWFATDNTVLAGPAFARNTTWDILYKSFAPGQVLPSSFDASIPRNDAQANANLISTINGFTKKTYSQETPITFNQITTTGHNLLINASDIVPGSTMVVVVKRSVDASENNFFNSINVNKAKIIYKSKHIR